MILTDLDGDVLEAEEVYGFGQRMLTVSIIQDGDYCGATLTVPQVEELKGALDEFLKVSSVSST